MVILDTTLAEVKNILIVEDNRINQLVLEKILLNAGYHVGLAGNGKEGLDMLDSGNFDLAIVDMKMPVMSGVEMIKTFRATNPDMTGFPVIILSADSAEETSKNCETLEITACLTKPVGAEELLTIISETGNNTDPTSSGHNNRHRDDKADNTILNVSILEEFESKLSDSEFLPGLLDRFQNAATRLISDIESTLREGNYNSYRDAVHALKGNAGSVGAISLQRCCHETEKIDNDSLTGKIEQILIDINNEYERAIESLRTYAETCARREKI